MKIFKKKTNPEMTQERLRAVEEYIQYRISQMTPEEQLYGEEKVRLRGDLDTYFSGLTQRLDEDGQAILDKYMKCYEELIKLKKDEAFLEGRAIALIVFDLYKELKKRPRK